MLGLAPTHGPAAGGNQLVISNYSFAPTRTVTIGGNPATIVSRTTSGEGSERGTLETAVTVVVPAGTAGTTVDVVLNNAGIGPLTGESDITDLSKYTYDADPEANGYSLVGSAVLKTLVKGSVPLTGSVLANVDAATNAFTADLQLNPSSASLTALGFLPVVAKINIVPTDKVRGALTGGVLSATAKVRIKIPSITLFGVPIAGGANCQTTQVSSIPLKSTAPFSLPQGGPIAGTFSISNLSGCGALNGIVSPLTAGKGNAIALSLTPKP